MLAKLNLCLHLVGSAGHVVHYGTSGSRNVDALFFMLGWAWCCFHKKHARTHYSELVFLHPVSAVGHVVQSGVSSAQNVDALFFMLGWNRYGLHKKHTGTRYTELVLLHPVGSVGHVVHYSCLWCKTSMHYFSCSGGPGVVSIKSSSGHLVPNLYFCIRWDLQVT
jgi:hypothetical protein